MEDVESLVRTSLGEIEKILSTKAVVGEASTFAGKTLVPLVAVGFAFGTGGGSGKADAKGKGEGLAMGTAGGGCVRPVAVVIIDDSGVRVEPIHGGLTSVMDRFVEEIPEMLRGRQAKGEEKP